MSLHRRACLSLAVAPLVVRAQGADLVIAVDAQNPPFMYAGSDGQARGVYPLLLRALFAELNQPLTLNALPWPRALAGLERAEHGVAGIYSTAERRARYDYSEPLHVETVRVYARRGRLRLFERIEDLRGLRVGVLRGWSYGDAFDAAARKNLFKLEVVAADQQNFGKLERDFLDVALAIEQAGDAQLATGAYPTVRAMANPLTENPTHLAFHKRTNQSALLARVNELLARWRRSGEHARLLAQGLSD